MAAAVFGFVGVLLGSVTTSVLTIYRERLLTRREQTARAEQDQRDRDTAYAAFQQDSILALQTAISDLIRAVNHELDRVLAEFNRTGSWPARQWETSVTPGWSDAVLQLQQARSRVFNNKLRSLADDLLAKARASVWADSKATAELHDDCLEPLLNDFGKALNESLRTLYFGDLNGHTPKNSSLYAVQARPSSASASTNDA
jgi:hypothetical protein